MIWNALFAWASGMVSILIAIFPASDPSTISAIESGTSPVRNLLSNLSFVFPVDLFLTALGIILATEILMLGVKALVYILHFSTLGIFKKL